MNEHVRWVASLAISSNEIDLRRCRPSFGSLTSLMFEASSSKRTLEGPWNSVILDISALAGLSKKLFHGGRGVIREAGLSNWVRIFSYWNSPNRNVCHSHASLRLLVLKWLEPARKANSCRFSSPRRGMRSFEVLEFVWSLGVGTCLSVRDAVRKLRESIVILHLPLMAELTVFLCSTCPEFRARSVRRAGRKISTTLTLGHLSTFILVLCCPNFCRSKRPKYINGTSTVHRPSRYLFLVVPCSSRARRSHPSRVLAWGLYFDLAR